MTIRSTARSAVRPVALLLAVGVAALTTGCVIAPNSADVNANRMVEVQKMSEQAIATCGAGNVKEVNAKSFTCK